MQGCLGILRSQEFWATAHDCTNDQAELVSANEVVIEIARSCRRAARGVAADVLDVFLQHYGSSTIGEIRTMYLICFSSVRDDPHQWENYGDGGRGICLGVRVLEERAPRNPASVSIMAEVDYSKDSLRTRVGEYFNNVRGVLSRATASRRNCEAGLLALYQFAAFVSITAKQEKWKDEKEVRHVTFARKAFGLPAKERMSSENKIVRYIPVQLRVKGKLIALSEIVIGPNQDPTPVQQQLEAALVEKGYTAGTIEYPRICISDVPRFNR